MPGGRADLDQLPLPRPAWEIQNIPTVCGQCPIGCNTYATIREGQVVRVLSRNNPAVDDGWLCDRGRYTRPACDAAERIPRR